MAKVRKALGRTGLTVEDVIERGRSSYFDHQAAMQILGYDPQPLFESGMHSLAEWVQGQGGAETLAGHCTSPLRDSDVETQMATAPTPG